MGHTRSGIRGIDIDCEVRMIAYFKCVCTTKHRLLAKRLRDEGFEIRITNRNPVHRKEAKDYGLRMPFVVVDGKATEIG